jgi:hypothetical protein
MKAFNKNWHKGSPEEKFVSIKQLILEIKSAKALIQFLNTQKEPDAFLEIYSSNGEHSVYLEDFDAIEGYLKSLLADTAMEIKEPQFIKPKRVFNENESVITPEFLEAK